MSINPLRPAIFLDRDGVLIENRPEHVKQWPEVNFLPGALEALARVASSKFLFVIVTNQAVIGRGLAALEEIMSINEQIVSEIRRTGGRVDGVYLCPHRPEDNCRCRKPNPGMLEDAARDLGIDLAASVLVGDAVTDAQAALAAGSRPVLVRTGRGEEQWIGLDPELRARVEVFPDLAAALETIVPIVAEK